MFPFQLHFYPPSFQPPDSWPLPTCFARRLSSSFNSHANAERHSSLIDKRMSKQAVHSSSSASIWIPRFSFSLACLSVRTLLQVGQQAVLARTLETLSIDICYLSETRLQDSSSVLTLRSPSGDTSSIFSLRLYGDDAVLSTGQAGVGIALSPRTIAVLVDWIPIISRMCAVRLTGSFKASKSRGTNRCLFIIVAYAPANCSDDSLQNDLYRQLTQLLCHRRSTDACDCWGSECTNWQVVHR
ncbi:unnamed protein product [Dicrocoelium dendriticum]|nr:unnamed protein product [Dicrocoelium dendriticum]